MTGRGMEAMIVENAMDRTGGTDAGAGGGAGTSGAAELRGKRVLVVGWARSGRAAARALHDAGARVFATDSRDQRTIAAEEDADRSGRALDLLDEAWWGGNPLAAVQGMDLVVVSPGVAPTVPLVAEARAHAIEVIGEIELAARLGVAPILGVTGTNGKSTVVTLLGECFQAAGLPAVVAGNVGVPLVSVYPPLPADSAAVVELSSYQLETIHRFHARGAIVLNLQPDHLGRHPTMDIYRDAKGRLLDTQRPGDFAVLVKDDPELAPLYPRVRGMLFEVSLKGPVARGGFVDPQGRLVLVGLPGQREAEVLMRRDEVALPGDHNLSNALGAAVAAVGWGLPVQAVVRALRSFRGLPHRIEPVGRVGRALWVNDSKGTNVDSTIAAIRAVQTPLVLIAGGVDKGISFAPLADAVRGRATSLVFFGEARERMAREMAGIAETRVVPDLAAAVAEAAALATRASTVLFSPAASSFDQFRDFEHRGEIFRELVRSLAGFTPVAPGTPISTHHAPSNHMPGGRS